MRSAAPLEEARGEALLGGFRGSLCGKLQRGRETGEAGALIRELERKLPIPVIEAEQKSFALYRRMLAQRPAERNKLYSLHEPHVYCIAKGKEHKKYEFGTKASIAMTKEAGIIVAAVAHGENLYDGHTLPEVLDLVEAVTDQRPTHAIVDRGYRGRKSIGDTEILVPGRPPAGQSKALNAKMRKRFRRRAAIEPVISHLKHDYRLARCFLKGFSGDQINLLLAAAWNLRMWMRNFLLFWLRRLSLQYPSLNSGHCHGEFFRDDYLGYVNVNQGIADEGEVDESNEHLVKFFKTREDSAEGLQAAEKALDLVAPFVEFAVVFPGREAIGFWRDTGWRRRCAACGRRELRG